MFAVELHALHPNNGASPCEQYPVVLKPSLSNDTSSGNNSFLNILYVPSVSLDIILHNSLLNLI